MTLAEWWNRTRYRLYAPVYDWAARPLEAGRRRAIERLELGPDDEILILGSGPGVDLDYLPRNAHITAVDAAPEMVERAARRADTLGRAVDARVGDAQNLSLPDDSYDAVLLHLVLSVVPDPHAVAAETARVLRPDGRASVFDKFVAEDEEPSLLRRMLNPAARVLFSDLTRSLDPMLAGSGLEAGAREPVFGGLYTITIARAPSSPGLAVDGPAASHNASRTEPAPGQRSPAPDVR